MSSVFHRGYIQGHLGKISMTNNNQSVYLVICSLNSYAMKRLLLFFAIISGFNFNGSAQISDGSVAPDFTFTDINGTSQNLYSYLNQGKTVVIDASATWCGPCWGYHESKVMDSLYEKHDMPGDKTWKVIFMEVDPTTNSADLNGTSGPQNTQGDWVTGVPYTIIDPPAGAALTSFNNGYGISYYPTFFMIMPNKRVYQHTLNDYQNSPWPPTVDIWENVHTMATGIDNVEDRNPLTIYPNPAVGNTNLYFNLNNSSHVALQVTNVMGQVVDKKDLGKLSAGDQSINYSVANLPAGLYYFTVAAENNRSITKKISVQ